MNVFCDDCDQSDICAASSTCILARRQEFRRWSGKKARPFETCRSCDKPATCTATSVCVRKAERSARERTFPKCACGNVAGVGQVQCRRCRAETEEREEADRIAAQAATAEVEREALIDGLLARVEALESRVAALEEQGRRY